MCVPDVIGRVLRILGVGVKCLGAGQENCIKGVKLQQCFQLSWKRHREAVQMWEGRGGRPDTPGMELL